MMSIRPRLKFLAVCIAAAVAQMAAPAAVADSGVGVDTALGNALNPPGRSDVPRPLLTQDGYDTVRHSPSGQLYGVPYDRSDEDTNANKTEGGWEVHGSVEAGALGGDANKKDATFRQYKDLKNGLYLNHFDVEGQKPDTANYIQAEGGGVGQKDQFYGVQFGRYNDWKVKVFYNETYHDFTDNYKSLYNGVGTNNLTLAASVKMPTIVTAGGGCTTTLPCWIYNGTQYANAAAVASIGGVATAAAGTQTAVIDSYLAGVGNSELSLVRKKGGARLDMTLTDNWKGYASFTEERRTGARPFSMNFGGGEATAQIAEPIDYTTSDFLAGLSYADKLTEINLRASASRFRDANQSLTVQNPVFNVATAWGNVQQSTISLPPSNDAFNLKGEFARKLPDFFNGRFTLSAAYGSNRQNDSLLPPLDPSASLGGGTIANGSGNVAFNVNNWKTTAALSQQTAKQRLDNELVNMSLTLKPIDDLDIKGTVRHYATINKSETNGHQYVSYNPLTGQYGYIKYNDSTGFSVAGGVPGNPCLSPSGVPVPGCTYNGVVLSGFGPANSLSGTPVYSLARDYKQDNFTLSADYDLGSRRSLEGSLERENFTRSMREREKTWENKFKLGYVDRGFDEATVRASIETDSRRGGDYNSGLLPNVAYYQQVAYALALPGNSITNIINQIFAGSVGYTGNPALTNYLSRYPVQMDRFDLANRDQNILNGRVNFNLRQDLDFGVMLQLKQVNYPDDFYGAQKDDQGTLNFDVNYQPAAGQRISAYYSRQEGRHVQAGNPGNGSCTVAGLGSAANALANCSLTNYGATTANGTGAELASSIWNMTTRDTNNTLGINFEQDLGNMKLGLDYTYAAGRTRITYGYGPTTFTAAQAAAELLLGNAMPDMTTVMQTFAANLLVPIEKNLSARLLYRYEGFKVQDWHYDNAIAGAVQSIAGVPSILLNAGPQNYHANIIGAFVQYKF
jgi:hypothetical protein